MNRKNEQRVICIEGDYSSENIQLSREAREDFWRRRSGTKIVQTEGESREVYLFNSLADAELFGSLLDARGVPFSRHPAKDYAKVYGKGMNDDIRSIFESVDRAFGGGK